MKILVVDDHVLFSAGLRMLLMPLQADLQVLECVNTAQALELLHSHGDVRLCLLDLALRHEDGLEAIGALKAACPEMAVVVVSANESVASIYAALDAGAMGYIPKSVTPDVMTHALKLVLAGSIYLPPQVLETAALGASSTDAQALTLTARQTQVLQCLLRGWPNKLISYHLNLSDNTVKTHLAAIYRALQVTSRAQAMVAAKRLGIRVDAFSKEAPPPGAA